MHRITHIYFKIRRLIRSEQYEEIDEKLENFYVHSMDLDTILAYLISTHCIKKKLKHRKRFFKDAKIALKQRGEYSGGLFWGLK